MFRSKLKIGSTVAAFLLICGLGLSSAPNVQAWPWDPHVHVWFNVNNCAGAAGQWGYYRADGEEGWVRWDIGYQGSFDLQKVSTSGSITRITWGTPGTTCGTRYFNITRPPSGSTAALGWIG